MFDACNVRGDAGLTGFTSPSITHPSPCAICIEGIRSLLSLGYCIEGKGTALSKHSAEPASVGNPLGTQWRQFYLETFPCAVVRSSRRHQTKAYWSQFTDTTVCRGKTLGRLRDRL